MNLGKENPRSGGWRRMAADGGGIDWMDPKTEEAGKEGSGGRK